MNNMLPLVMLNDFLPKFGPTLQNSFMKNRVHFSPNPSMSALAFVFGSIINIFTTDIYKIVPIHKAEIIFDPPRLIFLVIRETSSAENPGFWPEIYILGVKPDYATSITSLNSQLLLKIRRYFLRRNVHQTQLNFILENMDVAEFRLDLENSEKHIEVECKQKYFQEELYPQSANSLLEPVKVSIGKLFDENGDKLFACE